MADDPAEELFAAAAVEEAAMVGFCAFEMDALIRNRWGGFGVKVENVVAGAVGCAVGRGAKCAGDVADLGSARVGVQETAY